MFLCVQYGGCLWKKLFLSLCRGLNGPVLPAGGQSVRQREGRMAAVPDDAGCSAPSSWSCLKAGC